MRAAAAAAGAFEKAFINFTPRCAFSFSTQTLFCLQFVFDAWVCFKVMKRQRK